MKKIITMVAVLLVFSVGSAAAQEILRAENMKSPLGGDGLEVVSSFLVDRNAVACGNQTANVPATGCLQSWPWQNHFTKL